MAQKYYSQLLMMVAPTDPRHLTTKEYVDLVVNRKIKASFAGNADTVNVSGNYKKQEIDTHTFTGTEADITPTLTKDATKKFDVTEKSGS